MQQPRSLPDALVLAASRSPERAFLHFEGTALTYADAVTRVAEAAGSLAGWGLRRGDRVALYLGNSPDFVISYLAVLWLGGVVVPVNTRYRETELRHILSDSAARLVVTDAEGSHEVDRILSDAPAVEGVVVADEPRAWQRLSAGPPLPTPVALSGDDLAVIGYTSGTTGRSKGAMMTHGNFCSNSVAVTTAWGWTASDHLLLVLPLFHTHGLGVGLHGTLIQGSTITLKRGFVAPEVLAELASGRITMFFGVPTMYGRLLTEARKSPIEPRGVRLLVSGSAPLNPQVLEEIEAEFGLRILERYGMTETVMNLGNPLEGERRAGSVGFPFEGIEVRIASVDSNRPVPAGEVGEVQLRGSNICRGYWQAPEATAEVWTADGWFRTGDLGYRDPDGYVFLTGRARELIISGGFNVYPREVEEVLEAHPAVAEAAVLGLPDADLGEKVVAGVVSIGEVSEEALQEFCRERLASFKKPREVYLLPALPRNALGKVQKHLLREQLTGGAAGSPSH